MTDSVTSSMPSGWIKLYRHIMDNPMWQEQPFDRARAWIDLILLANHKNGYLRKRGIRIEIKRGQVGWSERALAERWGWSRGKVRRFLDELKTVQQIELQNEPQNINVTSLIFITNYDSYQSSEPQNGPQNEPQTGHKQYHRQECKEKTLYSDFFEILWDDYPAKDGKQAAHKHFNATVKTPDDCRRIRKALNNYLAMLKIETWRSAKNGSTWFNNWQDWEHWTSQQAAREPKRLEVAI